MSALFAILNPCPKRWSDLRDDGRKRFCNECQTYVHALDQYSAQEFDDLRRKSSGRVCGFLAGESLPEPRSRRAIVIGAFLATISPLMAQSGHVRIRVTDTTGAVLAQAEASLLSRDGKPMRTAYSNEAGEIVFADLPIGDLRFTVSRPGFQTFPLTVTLLSGNEVNVNAKLEVHIVGEVVTLRPKRRWWHIFR